MDLNKATELVKNAQRDLEYAQELLERAKQSESGEERLRKAFSEVAKGTMFRTGFSADRPNTVNFFKSYDRVTSAYGNSWTTEEFIKSEFGLGRTYIFDGEPTGQYN